MKRLSYSDKARDDLIRLRQFIATKSPVAAQRIGFELVQRIEKLRIFPEIAYSGHEKPPFRTMRSQQKLAEQTC